VTFLILIIFNPLVKSLLIAAIVGGISGLFSLGFMVRQLKRLSFEINSSNKAIDKGLSWYQERIHEQAMDMRFKCVLKTSNEIIYKPQSLYRVFESDIIVELSPYDIRISCSRMMLRIILDYLDLKCEELHA
jgi:hypothetical protein